MRLIGRLNLAGGLTTPDGNLQNAVIHKGTAYPTIVAEGQLFFRTDTKTLMVFNGTTWGSAGAGVQNPMVSDLSVGGYNIGGADNITANNIGAMDNVTALYNIQAGSAFYIGDLNSDGSWRFTVSGADLVIEKRVTGSWVTKQTIVG